MILHQRMWMIPAAHWAGMLGIAAAAWLLSTGLHAGWLALWALGHLAGSLAVSVGLHRYFTHGAFKTSPFWHWVLALYGTLTVQGSALGWAAAHQTHHVHSDTDRDPHITAWHYLWRKQYRDVPMEMWRVRKLVSDPAVAFTHRYGAAVIGAWVLALLLAGWGTSTGPLPLLFGYLAPLGTTHLVGAIHQVSSHRGGVHDWPLLNWLLPAAGEWMHGHHHRRPRDARLGQRWFHLDYGWWFIQLIRTDKAKATASTVANPHRSYP